MSSERLLNHPGYGIVISRLVAGELLGRLFESLLVQRLQIEGIGRLEHFLEEANQAIGPDLGFEKVLKGIFDFPRRAHAYFVPIVESVFQILKGAIRLLPSSALAANGIEKLFQNRPCFGLG